MSEAETPRKPSYTVDNFDLTKLAPWPKNPRKNEAAIDPVARSMARFGWSNPILARMEDSFVIAGHTRLKAAAKAGVTTGPVRFMDLSLMEAKLLAVADNKLGELSSWDDDLLLDFVKEAQEAGEDLGDAGFVEEDIEKLLAEEADRNGGEGKANLKLAERFLVPPFSVLDARQGYWQDRKRTWVSLGIRSEVGRGENLIGRSEQELELLKNGGTYHEARERVKARRKADAVPGGRGKGSARTTKGERPAKLAGKRLTFVAGDRDEASLDEVSKNILAVGSGTSIFDPVLCEIAYRWFSPLGGTVLDPFAGGSVRGIVAGRLGRSYVGIDLRAEQVAANREQGEALLKGEAPAPSRRLTTKTQPPVEKHGKVNVVRDDLLPGGTKRRVVAKLLKKWDAEELVYASPAFGYAQVGLAMACRDAGRRATVFVAKRSQLHLRTEAAKSAGAEIVEVEAGRLNVIQARARDYAAEKGALLVPFGLESEEALDALAEVAREAVPDAPAEVWCTSGSGVLTRALQRAWPKADHNVVLIGSSKAKTGDAKVYRAPEDFEEDAKRPPPFPSCSNYDAKAWAFIEKHASEGALFWNVAADEALLDPGVAEGSAVWVEGDSQDVDTLAPGAYDLIFSCPPYADLEVYSDDPRDLSTMDYATFREAYRKIIAKSVAMLKQDRFAVFVVGEVRGGKDGFYYRFVPDTIAAFEDAGARFYNEAVLVTSLGSLPIRAAKQFSSSRKLGKTHQNVLVFCKGDAKKAAEACGPVDVATGDPNEATLEVVDQDPLRADA